MMPDRLAVYPATGTKLGLPSWLGELAAGAAVRCLPIMAYPDNATRGDGHSVLLIPGFSSGDWAVLGLKRYLKRQGYRPFTAGLWFNPGPVPYLMRQLENKLLALSAGTRISLIGVSLGGDLARDLARRYPDRVRTVVTLCSPIRFPVVTPLAPFAWLFSPLFSPEWVARRHLIAEPLSIPVTAIHAERDGVVLREQCWLEPSPGARNVIVKARHMTVECAPQTLAAVAEALAV